MSNEELKPWPLQSSIAHGDFRIFRVREDIRTSPVTGHDLRFSILECHDWINVLPVTTDRRAVLIRQWRHGTDEITWEIPGGLMEPGETPAEAAARELREETGYACGRVVDAGSVTPNPAFINNRCFTCIAYGCEKVGEPEFDIGEDISVHTIPLDELREMVRKREIDHALVVAALYHCEFFVDEMR